MSMENMENYQDNSNTKSFELPCTLKEIMTQAKKKTEDRQKKSKEASGLPLKTLIHEIEYNSDYINEMQSSTKKRHIQSSY